MDFQCSPRLMCWSMLLCVTEISFPFSGSGKTLQSRGWFFWHPRCLHHGPNPWQHATEFFPCRDSEVSLVSKGHVRIAQFLQDQQFCLHKSLLRKVFFFSVGKFGLRIWVRQSFNNFLIRTIAVRGRLQDSSYVLGLKNSSCHPELF